MRIKRLEIKGFKSFPDKTVLGFKKGISSIVGPNGCGKSNVFEAIRWVMGEQRVRVLRSKRMEDVIFNGSDSRKPVGMAEVRLVLSNTDKKFPNAMDDYDEIMIARRLFRDGESQYEINNIPCRLSDVTDFFLDTGVGKNSYAIIEQGRVDMVVASKPEDRRVLIEEAAGINRYKARREAAIKKLEQTRQNLLRISDVIGEVKRQTASLKRQASRAERYRKLSEQLKTLDLQFHAFRCSHLTEQLARVRDDLEKSRTSLIDYETRFSSVQADLEQQRVRALETERALSELLAAHHKIELELASTRSGIERDRAAISRLSGLNERAAVDKTALQEKRDQGRSQLETLEKEKTAGRAALDAAKIELESAVESVRATDQILAQKKELYDRLRDDIFQTLQETAQERNGREDLKRRRSEIQMELEKIGQESSELALSLGKERSRSKELADKIREITDQQENEERKKEALGNDRKDTQGRIALLRDRAATSEKRLASDRARMESLEEMQKSYSAYEEGVRFLMQDMEFSAKEALLGPLAEMIEVPPEHQKALTAALGDRVGHLVVSSTREGVEAAGRLQEAGAGRTTFIPLSPRSETDPEPGDVPEGLTSLKDLVRFRNGFEGLGDFLLSRCFVVEDIREAVEIWEKNGVSVDLVTSNGEVINRHGEITGGSQDQVRDEVFEKKREISELRQSTVLLEQEISEIRSTLEQEESRLDELSAKIDCSDSLINELNVTRTGLRKDQESLATQMEGSRRRLDVLRLERERLEKELDGLAGQVRTAEEKIGRLEEKQSRMERERSDTGLKVEQLTAEAREKSGQSGRIRVRLAQLEERGVSLAKECGAAQEALEQTERQLASLIEEMERSAAEEKRLAEEIRKGEEAEKDLMNRHAFQTGEIESLRGDSGRVGAVVKELEMESAASEKSIRELRDAVHGTEMETVRIEQTLEGLVEKIVERYQLDPRAISCPETQPDENEINEIKSKLDSMGDVNLAAIAESRHIEERLAFLLEQEDDLKKAVDSLYATINKINKTTRERFQDAFSSINEKFQEIFPFLFRGGEARLELTDEEDLLETGVDIMARPPGKRIRNMDLLSGGEKALTAVALIFAIFLTRPSPFCLLDEVDAPLDDSNIVRFNEMLAKLSSLTQFLVITHNKKSMETADTLYGVTMEEPGASTVVAVEFMN